MNRWERRTKRMVSPAGQAEIARRYVAAVR